jgi:hypothetical protein
MTQRWSSFRIELFELVIMGSSRQILKHIPNWGGLDGGLEISSVGSACLLRLPVGIRLSIFLIKVGVARRHTSLGGLGQLALRGSFMIRSPLAR